MKKKISALLSIAIFCLISTSAFALPAFEFTSPGNSFTNGNWNLGINFSVNSTVTVTGLGYYADPYTTNVDSNEVALYKSDGTLLASVIVDNTYDLYDHFRYVTINPVTLEVGNYQIDGVSQGNNYTWDDVDFYTDPAITYLSDIWSVDPSSAFFQSSGGSSDITDGIWGPNLFLGQPEFIGAVPEPSTIILLGFGLAGLGWYGRKRKQA